MSNLQSIINGMNLDLQGLLNPLREDMNMPPLVAIPLVRARPVVQASSPSRFPIIPTQFARAICPEWTDEQATKASHIITYRESSDSSRFCYDFHLRDCPNLFWTGIRVTHTRNVPAKFRVFLGISQETEYTLFDWAPLPNKEWIPLPSILPGFFTSPGKIYIQVDIPSVPGQTDDIHVVFDMIGFERLLHRYPRFDLNDKRGNRVLTWIPSRSSEYNNDATLYHPLYDPEPPFEPNCEILRGGGLI